MQISKREEIIDGWKATLATNHVTFLFTLTRKECHEDSNYMIKRCYFVHINKSSYFNLKEIIKN